MHETELFLSQYCSLLFILSTYTTEKQSIPNTRCALTSQDSLTTSLIGCRLSKELWHVEAWTLQDFWRCSVVSGTKVLAAVVWSCCKSDLFHRIMDFASFFYTALRSGLTLQRSVRRSPGHSHWCRDSTSMKRKGVIFFFQQAPKGPSAAIKRAADRTHSWADSESEHSRPGWAHIVTTGRLRQSCCWVHRVVLEWVLLKVFRELSMVRVDYSDFKKTTCNFIVRIVMICYAFCSECWFSKISKLEFFFPEVKKKIITQKILTLKCWL